MSRAPSIVLIQSREAGNSAIGTGFIIHQAGEHSYILTCAHVVRDVGGEAQVVAGKQPAEVIAMGEHDGLDLAVLRVAHFTDRTPLSLRASAQAGQTVSIQGYSKYIQYRPLETLNGRTTQLFLLSDSQQQRFADAWYITIENQQRLLGGYSGSPVCTDDGAVIGVMITSEGEQQGRAISIAALRHIWPTMPEGLVGAGAAPALPPATRATPTQPVVQGASDPQAGHLKELIRIYTRRLQILEIQRAQRGIYTEPHILMEIEDLQQKIAECEAQLGIRKPLEVELLAFATAISSGTAAESLDWRRYYAQATPTPALWQSTLIPELLGLKQRLKRKKATTLLLDSDTRLSAALAFGYAFRQTTGFQLRVNQYGEIWTTEAQPAAPAPLTDPKADPQDSAGRDITIELSSARQNIHPDVKTWLDAHPRLVARRVCLAVSVEKINGPAAMAIARAIFQLMRDQRRTSPPPQTIHFFAAMPKGLAVLIGWHLHTCGPLQFYEKLGDSYQTACLLDERW
ncbi:MAG: trypsin-like peptidase domain-containing protein [Oscillochloris sp.]|nr:trypsin-like peptidase domain-containing protein [Oscillochloris sp.]